MIVSANTSGRLGNRLVSFFYVFASALQSGQRLVFLTGKDILDLFDHDCFLRARSEVVIVRRTGLVEFLLRCQQSYHERFSPINELARIDKSTRWIQAVRAGKCPVHFMFDWYFRDNTALVLMREKMREIMRIQERFVRAPTAFWNRHAKGKETVGVHVRRGDYRTWNEGRFYYSDEEYLRFLSEMSKSVGQAICFFIVSDETVDLRAFEARGLDVHLFKGVDYREDLVMLTLCDYVLGPVSTFSWWAAYYGGAKYFAIRDRRTEITKDLFKPIQGGEFDVPRPGQTDRSHS